MISLHKILILQSNYEKVTAKIEKLIPFILRSVEVEQSELSLWSWAILVLLIFTLKENVVFSHAFFPVSPVAFSFSLYFLCVLVLSVRDHVPIISLSLT